VLFFFFKESFVLFFREREWEHEWEGQRERERESQAGSQLSAKPHAGLKPKILRSGPRDHDLSRNQESGA